MNQPRGMVLLEIVLAIALFAASATVLLGALSSATRTLERVRDDAIAADLLITTQSMLRMGLIDIADAGPEAFEGGPDGWTWQIIADSADGPLDAPPMVQVRIVIAKQSTGVRRQLAQLMPDPLAVEVGE